MLGEARKQDLGMSRLVDELIHGWILGNAFTVGLAKHDPDPQ